MAYVEKKQVFANAIEVVDYHTARYGAPGQKRVKRKKPTPEEMERVNQMNRERLARWRLWEHFDVDDYFTLLTYKKEARPPDMGAAKEDFRKFVREVRKEYAKRGAALKWMRNIEVGSKGAWHVHVIVNRIPDTDVILNKAWEHGKVVSQLLYEKGGFQQLAAYITKTPKTDKRLKESNYSTSRNLPLPEPKKKIYRHWKHWRDIEKVKVPEGFYLDSYHEGINPVTGYLYRRYILLRIRRESHGIRGSCIRGVG